MGGHSPFVYCHEMGGNLRPVAALFGVAGLLTLIRQVIEYTEPAYYDPVTSLDYAAAWLTSIAGVTVATAFAVVAAFTHQTGIVAPPRSFSRLGSGRCWKRAGRRLRHANWRNPVDGQRHRLWTDTGRWSGCPHRQQSLPLVWSIPHRLRRRYRAPGLRRSLALRRITRCSRVLDRSNRCQD